MRSFFSTHVVQKILKMSSRNTMCACCRDTMCLFCRDTMSHCCPCGCAESRAKRRMPACPPPTLPHAFPSLPSLTLRHGFSTALTKTVSRPACVTAAWPAAAWPSAGPPGLTKTVSRPACGTAARPGRPKTVSRAAWSGCLGVFGWWCHVPKPNPRFARE